MPPIPALLPNDVQTSFCDAWWIHSVDTVESTNPLAGRLPAWHSVRAKTQTRGRGRTGRAWTSDVGGLWLSAALPCPAKDACWTFLPLAVGWGLIQSLREWGVSGVRLRWPNDLMVDRRKLAGILVERFTPDTVVVGVGLNVFNAPETADAALAGMTTRLADLLPDTPSLEKATLRLLAALRRAHENLRSKGFADMVDELNQAWSEPRRVELRFAGQKAPLCGQFAGINPDGHLRLLTDQGGVHTYDATQVALLRELE